MIIRYQQWVPCIIDIIGQSGDISNPPFWGGSRPLLALNHLELKWVAIVSDPSGSGRVDILTGPVAAARAVVATGAWVKSKHDMYLIRGSVRA